MNMGTTALGIACLLLLAYLRTVQAGDNKKGELSENDLIEVISIYEEQHREFTMLPTEEPVAFVPRMFQKHAMAVRDKVANTADQVLSAIQPTRSESEMRDNLRKLAGRCLALAREMLQEANSNDNAKELRLKTAKLRNTLIRISTMSADELNQLAAEQIDQMKKLPQVPIQYLDGKITKLQNAPKQALATATSAYQNLPGMFTNPFSRKAASGDLPRQDEAQKQNPAEGTTDQAAGSKSA